MIFIRNINAIMKKNNNLNSEVNKLRKMMGLNESFNPNENNDMKEYFDLDSAYEDKTYIPDDENPEFIDHEEFMDDDDTEETCNQCDENLEYGIQGESQDNDEKDDNEEELDEIKTKRKLHRLKITNEQFDRLVRQIISERIK